MNDYVEEVMKIVQKHELNDCLDYTNMLANKTAN